MRMQRAGGPAGNVATDVAAIAALSARQILITLDAGLDWLDRRPHWGSSRESRDEFYRTRYDLRRWRAEDRRRFLAKVNRLKRNGLIRLYRRDKELVMALTQEGQRRARRAALGAIEFPQPTRWDRRWHLIIFDIPEEDRLARDVFRRKLRQLGFAKLQKSVFIHPFDATDLVAGIRASFDLEDEIRYVVVDQLEDEKELIQHFLERGILRRSQFRSSVKTPKLDRRRPAIARRPIARDQNTW